VNENLAEAQMSNTGSSNEDFKYIAKASIQELKSVASKPPQLVKDTLTAVMI
jgi:hypothetical protein